MGPTPLERHLTIDQIDSTQKSFSSIHDDELKGIPFEASLIKVIQEPLPGGLGFSKNLTKIDHLLLSIGLNPQGHYHSPPLGTGPGLTPQDDAI
jgi:hypothetical protein